MMQLRASWIQVTEAEIAAKGERPAYWLRTEFELAAAPSQAILRISARGIYQGFMNGWRVGNDELTPGSTQYRTRIQIQTYDVSAELLVGANALVVLVADGWFRGCSDVMRVDRQFGNHVGLIAELVITHHDGSEQVIATGPNFKFRESHILGADLFLGQVEDRRLFDKKILRAGFDDTKWQTPDIIQVAAELIEPIAPAIRRVETLKPKSIHKLSEGCFVVDFGQNINGWTRLNQLGPVGTRITITHAEWLAPNGDITTENLDVQFPFMPEPIYDHQIDVVTSAGLEGDFFEPKFTTHGFQFVRLEGFVGDLTEDDIEAVVVHTDLRRIGHFSSSDERLTWLHEAAVWSFRSNACDLPTDCPHRERAGWSGDWQIFVSTAAYLYDIDTFSRKWLADACIDQQPSGLIVNISPLLPSAQTRMDMQGSSGWGDVIVEAPLAAYCEYGKTAALVECFDAMERWVGFAQQSAANGRHESRSGVIKSHEKYLWDTGFHWGEWMEPGFSLTSGFDSFAAEDKSEVATAYFYRSSRDLATICDVLDKPERAEHYRALASNIRQAWQTEFLDSAGSVKTQTQAAHVRALEFGLVPEKAQPAVAANLARLIRDNGTRLATGFLSTPFLLPVLADHGYVDLAYELLFQAQRPSWMHMQSKGATTVWESWDGVDDAGKPQASLNHYSKGAVVSFLHRYIAGLKPSSAGYETFVVKPFISAGLTWAGTTLNTDFGTIEVGWKLDDERLTISTAAPAGTTGTIELPDGSLVEVAGGSNAVVSCTVL